MSNVIQSYNQEIQNSLTQTIILYLKVTLVSQIPETSNIASMIIACQRKMKNANIMVQPVSNNVTNHRIFQPSKSELFDTKNCHSYNSRKNDSSEFQPLKTKLFDTKNHSSIMFSQKTVIRT